MGSCDGWLFALTNKERTLVESISRCFIAKSVAHPILRSQAQHSLIFHVASGHTFILRLIIQNIHVQHFKSASAP
jgi:hypothetical protein